MVSVLIIENDPTLQELYEKILEKNKFEVIAKVTSGIDAIEKYRLLSKKPDVVLVDYRMPDKNGIEIIKEILKIDDNAQVIMVSGDINIEEECIKQGAKMFIKKPFNYYQLVDGINKVSNHFYTPSKAVPL